MNTEDLVQLTIADASQLIREKKLSPVELVDASLARIQALNKTLNAFITVLSEQGRKDAKRAEAEIAAGKHRGPMHGIPVALKDIFTTKGIKTTIGSKVTANWVPDYDSTVTLKLRQAGAILVGKTNLHEFAAGATGTNSYFGPCVNPWNAKYVPGGSSSGSGAAIAASMCLGALGTDTGGSVRIPASLTGTVGLKPTYGLISRHGVFPLSWSLDHPGPMTKTVEDCAIMLQALAGYDPKDLASARIANTDYTASLGKPVRNLRVGVPKQFFLQSSSAEVERLVRKALVVLEELGTEVMEVSLPHIEYASYVSNVISWSEAAAVHEEWLRTRPQEYSDQVRERLMSGALFPATLYHQAQRVRAVIRREMEEALEQVDVMVTPTCPVSAPRIGQDYVDIRGRKEPTLGTLANLTRPFNLAGLPVISVSCGFGASGLPAGMSIAGPHFTEGLVMQVAHAYEEATGWHKQHPNL